MRCISLITALILLPGTALGASFSVPLPGLVGHLSSAADSKESSFDVGQQFSAIENVWIEVEARVVALEFDSCGTIFDPQPCAHEVHLLGFVARMDKQESSRPGTIFSDGLSFSDDSQVHEAYGVDTAVFNNLLVGWDFLLDGESRLTLFWNNIAVLPDRNIQNVTQPSGEIFSARLIIEGTPVPEPSTALLVAGGLLALAFIYARSSKRRLSSIT